MAIRFLARFRWSIALAVAACAPALGAAAANDYGQAQNWLCRPGRTDACSAPTTSTVIAADGVPHPAEHLPRPDAPIDCFYVYPTVSPEPTANSDMLPTGVEEATAKAQFARFAAQCRPFAPRYRQVTVAGLRAALGHTGAQPDVVLAYQDVVDAWHHYLANDNHGRGFVLIGHSQGAKILVRLIAAEIDGKPLAAQLVSAIVPGTLVEVPPHATVGGTFSHLRLCGTAADTGCVIAYSSYLASDTPTAHPRYGVATSPDRVAACVDPGGLSGSTSLDAVMPARLLPGEGAHTDFVELPSAVQGACVTKDSQSFLAISVNDGLLVERSLAAVQSRRPDWGLHVLDLNLALGNLVQIVATQARAWRSSAEPGVKRE